MANAPTTQTLDRLPPGKSAAIARIQGEEAFRHRLAELGFLPGTQITAIRRAPLGDPIEIRLRGYHLALRREDAKKILLQD